MTIDKHSQGQRMSPPCARHRLAGLTIECICPQSPNRDHGARCGSRTVTPIDSRIVASDPFGWHVEFKYRCDHPYQGHRGFIEVGLLDTRPGPSWSPCEVCGTPIDEHSEPGVGVEPTTWSLRVTRSTTEPTGRETAE